MKTENIWKILEYLSFVVFGVGNVVCKILEKPKNFLTDMLKLVHDSVRFLISLAFTLYDKSTSYYIIIYCFIWYVVLYDIIYILIYMSYHGEQGPLSWTPGGCEIFTGLILGHGSVLPLIREVRSIENK